MGQIQRQSVKSTIYIYAGVLIGFVYTGILMPRFLTPGEIGALNLIVSYALVFAQFGSLGFNIAAIKFFPYFQDKAGKHNGFLFLSIAVGIAGCLAVALLYYLLKPWLISQNIQDSPVFAAYFFLILPVSFFMIFFNLFDAYARGLYYSTTGAFLNEFFKRLATLLVILLFVLDLIDRTGLFLLYAMAISLPAMILVAFLIYKKEFVLQADFSMFRKNRSLSGEMVNVSLLGLLTGFGILAVAQIDRIMVNMFLSESETGIYSTTFYFGTLVILPSRAILRIAPSFIANAFKSRDMKTIYDIYYKSCINQFLLAFLLFLIIWINIDAVFVIISPEFISGKYVIFWIGVANIITMAGGMSSSIIVNSKFYPINALFVAIFLALIVISNYLFIPRLGITGAALASAISTFIYIFMKFLLVKVKFGFQPYNYKFLLVTGYGLAAYGLAAALPDIADLYAGLAVKSSVIALVFIALTYFTKISSDINAVIDGLVKRIFSIKK